MTRISPPPLFLLGQLLCSLCGGYPSSDKGEKYRGKNMSTKTTNKSAVHHAWLANKALIDESLISVSST